MSAKDIANLDIADVAKLDNYTAFVLNRKLNGPPQVQDRLKWIEWTEMSSQKKLDANMELEWHPYMDEQHFEEALNYRQQLASAAAGNQASKDWIHAGLRQGELVHNAVIQTKVFGNKAIPTASSGRAQQEKYAQIESHINSALQHESIVKGKSLTPDEIVSIIDREAIRYAFSDGSYQHISNMTPEEQAEAYTPYKEIDPQDLKELKNYALSLNPPRVLSKGALERAAAAWTLGDFERAQIILQTEE
jgi:hypothetical protein